MTILVSLVSKKYGELKKFLENYYYESTQIDEDVMEWIYIYNKPEDAVSVLNIFLSNIKGLDISLWIQINDDDLICVNEHNKCAVIQNINQINTQNV